MAWSKVSQNSLSTRPVTLTFEPSVAQQSRKSSDAELVRASLKAHFWAVHVRYVSCCPLPIALATQPHFCEFRSELNFCSSSHRLQGEDLSVTRGC